MDLASGVGGLAAIGTAATLLAGVAGRPMRGTGPAGRHVRPWLVTLLGINAGRLPHEQLRWADPVDVVLLALAAVTYAGFWPGPGTARHWWMALAIGQPVLGITLLLATRLLGRSALMGGGIVLSILALRDGTWTTAGWYGLVINLLLLVGDIGTTGRPSRLRAGLFVVGYGALITWFGWLAVLLLT